MLCCSDPLLARAVASSFLLLMWQVAQGGSAAEAGMAGAINGLGAKVGSLEALLTLTQQRIADKADAAELAALR